LLPGFSYTRGLETSINFQNIPVGRCLLAVLITLNPDYSFFASDYEPPALLYYFSA
jgi:hypothetical protein